MFLCLRNKILIAFDCRQIKNSIGGNIPYDTDITNDENKSITNQLGVFTVSLGERDDEMVFPSQPLCDERVGSDLLSCCLTLKT